MTRKEIEKRCREEMQQNIPNKDALWARIEENLPEQQPQMKPEPKVQFNLIYRAMAAAACFLFVAAGASLWKTQQKLETLNTPEEESSYDIAGDDYAGDDYAAEDGDDADAEGDAPDEAPSYHNADTAPKAEHNASDQPLSYDDLNVTLDGSFPVKTELLSADGEYFQEEHVLAQTDCFVDALIDDAWQDEETGDIIYKLEIVDVYGNADVTYKEQRIVSSSPYLLEIGHEYVLPLRYGSRSKDYTCWRLSYSCAPQIERTNDNKILFHNGWYSLMTDDSVPVLCDSNGVDDFFYDRMYLTGYTELEAFLYEWERGTL